MSLAELDLEASDGELDLDGAELGSVSDSDDLTCVACKISSKQRCPVAARKGELGGSQSNAQGEVRVGWGKYTARRLKSRSGRKLKVRRRCGAWCRLCANILKKMMKQKKYKKITKLGMKKGDKHAAVNKIKEELEDGTLSERWKRGHTESIHVLAGGKSRVYSKGAAVHGTREEKHELSQTGKFYFLSKYKEVFGDPAITKGKIVTRRWKGKRVRGIIVVSGTDAGVLDHTSKSSAGVRKDCTKFNAADALVEEDLDDAESDALSEMSQDFSHPGPPGAHSFSLECAGEPPLLPTSPPTALATPPPLSRRPAPPLASPPLSLAPPPPLLLPLLPRPSPPLPPPLPRPHPPSPPSPPPLTPATLGNGEKDLLCFLHVAILAQWKGQF